MPLIWCAVSSHGYGHAAQLAPILNALGRAVPHLRVLLRTEVPGSFFAGRLQIPWELSPAPQDVGCVQHGPLHIDIPATWDAHERFHAAWKERVAREAAAMQRARPDLVLADVPPLAIQAAAEAGLPIVALGSLSWDQVLEPYLSPSGAARRAQLGVLEQIREAYSLAGLMIRLTPGLPMPAFKRVLTVGPVLHPVTAAAAQLRALLGAGPDETLVLVGFGGIALSSLPLDALEGMVGYRFLVDRLDSGGRRRLSPLEQLPLPFSVILASVDALVTKPGYSTIVEAVHHRRPVVYVRRCNFADEDGLVDYLHRHGRGVELSSVQFRRGHWQDALRQASMTPPPSHPVPLATGAEEAARALLHFLEGEDTGTF